MFDEHVPQPPTAPAGPAKDMFDEIPSNLPFAPAKPAPTVPVGGVTPPLQQTPSAPTLTPPTAVGSLMPPMSYADDVPRSHGLRNVLLVLASIVVIGIAGFLAYKLVIQPKDDSVDVTATETPSDSPTNGGETDTPTVPAVEPPVVEEPVVEAPVVKDTDGDGLNDEEEAKAGTDPKLADSDRDGLGDREEIQVYGTDPLDPDTDKDSYLDGQEVKSGFNPNGPGKLFEIPK